MDKVVILDFGSQYTQLIARRVRELDVCAEIYPYNKVPSLNSDVKAIILSGSPCSVISDKLLEFDLDGLVDNYPVLGVCYGAQYIANHYGGLVEKSEKREYGRAEIKLSQADKVLNEIEGKSQVWMSHGDSITKLSDQFEIIASTADIPVAAYRSKDHVFSNPIYCVQFHPEVTHTLCGKDLLRNFLYDIAQCSRDWTADSFIDMTVADIKSQIGDDKVIMGLSGGVDSTVAASLLHQAIGDQLYCIFIDNGLLRKNEFDEVLASYQGMGLNIQGIDASKQFLDAIEGISDPEAKRKKIGHVFIDVFEEASKKIEGAKWLGQGTIYPDVIESASVLGPSETIKSHHNVGGLPDKLDLKIIEPLRMLFKDEVRKVGYTMNNPKAIVSRHPFPGPGLSIRILGPVTPEKVKLNQEADAIFIGNLKKSGWYDKVWQAGTILLPVKSVGVMGDERTYEFTVALRAVISTDGMTADWVHLPYELLADTSNDIINKVKGINRVVYDISSKPPATIEWE